MGRIKKLIVEDQLIIEIDYSDLNEAKMKDLVIEAKEIGLAENRQLLVLSIFNNKNYLTPGFMRYAEKTAQEVLHLTDKHAIVGLNIIQKFILSGFNILLQRNFKAFDTREDAIRYLLDKNLPEADLPEHFKKKVPKK